MKKVKVWDLAVRVSHLLFGVLVLGAFLTSDSGPRETAMPVSVTVTMVARSATTTWRG